MKVRQIGPLAARRCSRPREVYLPFESVQSRRRLWPRRAFEAAFGLALAAFALAAVGPATLQPLTVAKAVLGEEVLGPPAPPVVRAAGASKADARLSPPPNASAVAAAASEGPAVSVISAYAPRPADTDALTTGADRTDATEAFDVLLGSAPSTGSRSARIAANEHWWSDRPLPDGVSEPASLRCLSEAVYFEGRGESVRGQEAVAQVVLNRVKNPAYPDDVCGVVHQNREQYKRCQFTFACDRLPDVVRDPAAWAVAAEIAGRYASGAAWDHELGAVTHYHAHGVTPSWSRNMRRATVIGAHRFYITEGGGWT